MTFHEAQRWSAYLQKHGLNSNSRAIVPKLEQGFALLATLLVNTNGGFKGGRQAKIEDFLPDRSDEAGDTPESVQALLASLWSGKASGPKRRLWKRPGKS